MGGNLACHRDQVRMRASVEAGGHFAVRQAVAGQRALEQFDGHRLQRCALFVLPERPMNDARGAFAELVFQFQALPANARQRRGGLRSGLRGFAERIIGKGQPRQARQVQQPVRQIGQAVGGDAQQFQPGAVGHFRRQRLQLVACQHQLLQAGAAPDGGGQRGDLVVGQHQPAQRRGQRGGRHRANLVAPKTHHAQLWAAPQHFGQLGEAVVRTKNNAQLVQPGQIIGQRCQRIVRQVQNLQRVGQRENFGGKSF